MADETIETEETAVGGAEAAVQATVEENSEGAGGSASAAEDTTAAATDETGDAASVPEPAKPVRMIQPDINFVREVIGAGGSDLKKCFQCATCSVVCNVTPDANPFPRKEMIWAQWGLKEKLVADPDIWLCHQCNDCTAQCPRDAKPGRVMQAIAKMSIPSLSKPGFLAKGIGNPAALLLMAAIPVIILAFFIAIVGDYTPLKGEIINGRIEHKGEIVYASFLGHWPIVGLYTTFFVLSIIIFAMGIRSYWGSMKEHVRNEGNELKGSGLSQIGTVLSDIVTHKRFGKCDETKDRKISHLFIFYSFLLLFAATGLSTLFTDLPLLWGGQGSVSPYVDWHPVKWFGYSGAIAGLIGIGLITINRFKHQKKIGLGSYFDWLLISLVILLMVTGVGSVTFRKLDISSLAYPTYFVHLSAVLFLFIYAPFSKMAHMIYRATAMTFARAAGRDTPM